MSDTVHTVTSSIAAFRQALREVHPDEHIAVADTFVDAGLYLGLIPTFHSPPKGRRELRVRATDSRRSSIFSIHVQQGDLLLQERWLMMAAAFDRTEEGKELQDRLQKFVAGWCRQPSPGGFPNVFLRDLRNDHMRAALLTELEWIAARL
jgi:hypothetical protein